MSSLQKNIESAISKAMKERDSIRLDALRMLKSDIQYELTKTGAKELSDEQVEAILKRASKKRKESIEQFEKAGRNDLADKEKLELKIIDEYLPEAVSEEIIQQTVKKVFDDLKPKGPQEMGKIMGAVMGKFKGQNVDGNLVKNIITNAFQK